MSFIGVFDSGLGGLTILKALQTAYPHENFQYLADTKNIPYGDKNPPELMEILINNINYFKNAKAIVIACNTMSSLIPQLTNIDIPIISIVDNLIQTTLTDYNDIINIGILATTFTVNSNIYPQTFSAKNPAITVSQIAAPLLVPAIEQCTDDCIDIGKTYLNSFAENIHHVILGCTHYNILLPEFQRIFPNMTFVHPYKSIINQLQIYIDKNISCPDIVGSCTFVSTNLSDQFQQQSEKIIGSPILWQEIII